MKRPSDAEVKAWVDNEEQTAWTEHISELWRARRAESDQLKRNARLLKALLKLWYCSHGEGAFCTCRKMARVALRLEGVVL